MVATFQTSRNWQNFAKTSHVSYNTKMKLALTIALEETLSSWNHLKLCLAKIFTLQKGDIFLRHKLGGGGGTLVLFVVRGRAIFGGTFFKQLRNCGYHFHNFLTFHGIMGVLFRGFSQFPEL